MTGALGNELEGGATTAGGTLLGTADATVVVDGTVIDVVDPDGSVVDVEDVVGASAGANRAQYTSTVSPAAAAAARRRSNSRPTAGVPGGLARHARHRAAATSSVIVVAVVEAGTVVARPLPLGAGDTDGDVDRGGDGEGDGDGDGEGDEPIVFEVTTGAPGAGAIDVPVGGAPTGLAPPPETTVVVDAELVVDPP